MDCLDLLAVQWTLKSLLQHHSSKASILRHSAFFMVQISYLYMTTRKTLILQTFVGTVMSLLFNMLSILVTDFLPTSTCLLISWLQSPSAVILEPKKINYQGSNLCLLLGKHRAESQPRDCQESAHSQAFWFNWSAMQPELGDISEHWRHFKVQ